MLHEWRFLTTLLAEKAIEFLRTNPEGKPFCLSISFKEPHGPWNYFDPCAPNPYEHTEIPPSTTCTREDYLAQPQFLRESLNGSGAWPKDAHTRFTKSARTCYRLITGMDAAVGRIMAALEELGLDDNTVVIFTSDHGALRGAHGLSGKWILYEESVGVPFIMAMKGAIPGGRVDRKHLVSNGLDLLPTLCDYAGIETPRGLAGRSLRPLAEGRDVAEWRSDVFAESRNGRMVRTARFKYCVHEAGERREMLVNLDRDPGEMKNLAGSPRYRDELNRHRRLLLSWLEKQQDTLGLSYAVRPEGARKAGLNHAPPARPLQIWK